MGRIRVIIWLMGGYNVYLLSGPDSLRFGRGNAELVLVSLSSGGSVGCIVVVEPNKHLQTIPDMRR